MKSVRKILELTFSIGGSLLSVYVAGYWLFFRPVRWLITSYTAGTMTRSGIIFSVVKIFLASTVGGGIWCIFDIIAGKFRDLPED